MEMLSVKKIWASALTACVAVVLVAVANGNVSKKIYGGIPVTENKYPWMVSFQVVYDKRIFGIEAADHFCGGALIDPTHVLTAAHCFFDSKLSEEQMRDNFVAAFNHPQISARYDPSNKNYVRLKRFIIHPGYNPDTISNDIAIVELASPVTQVTKFPSLAVDVSEYGEGADCTVIGWGLAPASEVGTRPSPADQFSCANCGISCTTCLNGFQSCDEARCYDFLKSRDEKLKDCSSCVGKGLCPSGFCQPASDCQDVKCLFSAYQGLDQTFDIIPYDLRQADVKVLSDSKCRRTYDSYFEMDENICAGEESGGEDSCQGDSGGPLFVGGESNPKLIGIVSYGSDAGCALAGAPGVYTEISAYANWVDEYVEVPGAKSFFQSTNGYIVIASIAVIGFCLIVGAVMFFRKQDQPASIPQQQQQLPVAVAVKV